MLNAAPRGSPIAPYEGQKASKSRRSQNEGIPEVYFTSSILVGSSVSASISFTYGCFSFEGRGTFRSDQQLEFVFDLYSRRKVKTPAESEYIYKRGSRVSYRGRI